MALLNIPRALLVCARGQSHDPGAGAGSPGFEHQRRLSGVLAEVHRRGRGPPCRPNTPGTPARLKPSSGPRRERSKWPGISSAAGAHLGLPNNPPRRATRRGLGPVDHAQRRQDGGDVGLHGLLGHAEAFGDLAVAQAVAHQPQHLALARRQGAEQGPCRPPAPASARAARRRAAGAGRRVAAGRSAPARPAVRGSRPICAESPAPRRHDPFAVVRGILGRAQHQDADARAQLLQALEQRAAAQVGQVVVHDHAADLRLRLQDRERLRAVGRRMDRDAGQRLRGLSSKASRNMAWSSIRSTAVMERNPRNLSAVADAATRSHARASPRPPPACAAGDVSVGRLDQAARIGVAADQQRGNRRIALYSSRSRSITCMPVSCSRRR